MVASWVVLGPSWSIIKSYYYGSIRMYSTDPWIAYNSKAENGPAKRGIKKERAR